MSGAVQVINSDHNDIQKTAFLPLMDRNFIFAVVEYESMTQVTTFGITTLPFLTDLELHPPEMFTWDGVNFELSVTDYAGIYHFTCRLNAGSGVAGGTSILAIWLEKSLAGGAYSEVLGSRVYQAVPETFYSSLSFGIPVKILQPELPAKFRVRGTVVYPSDTGIWVPSVGRLLQVIALQANNAPPAV